MYRSKYTRNTEGLASDEGCRYLAGVLGEELSDILRECAIIQPEDPILFLASELER